jgi:single-strand DNA-binding protein
MNSVNIIGRLVRDPEEVATKSGTEMTTFSIAVDKGRDDASFFDCKSFKSTAANVAKYKHKGDQIGVSGHLDQDRWEKDGQKRSKVVIIADHVDFIGGKGEATQAAPAASQGPEVDAADDDIPF